MRYIQLLAFAILAACAQPIVQPQTPINVNGVDYALIEVVDVSSLPSRFGGLGISGSHFEVTYDGKQYRCEDRAACEALIISLLDGTYVAPPKPERDRDRGYSPPSGY